MSRQQQSSHSKRSNELARHSLGTSSAIRKLVVTTNNNNNSSKNDDDNDDDGARTETNGHHHQHSRRRRLVKAADHLTTSPPPPPSGLLSAYPSHNHHLHQHHHHHHTQELRSNDTRPHGGLAEPIRHTNNNNRIGQCKSTAHSVSDFLTATTSNKDVDIIIEPDDTTSTSTSQRSASRLTTTMDADSSTVEYCGRLAKSPCGLKRTSPKSPRVNSSPSFKAESPSSTTTDIQSNVSLMDLDDNHRSLLGGPSSGVGGVRTTTSSSSKRFFANNSRERWSNLKCRQQNVNGAFNELRRLVPTYPHDKKLSKNEILRLAIKYIRLLSNVLEYQKEEERKVATPDNRHEALGEGPRQHSAELHQHMAQYAVTYHHHQQYHSAGQQSQPPQLQPLHCPISTMSTTTTTTANPFPNHFHHSKTPIRIEIPGVDEEPRALKRQSVDGGGGGGGGINEKRSRLDCNSNGNSNDGSSPLPPEMFHNSSVESSSPFFTDSEHESDA